MSVERFFLANGLFPHHDLDLFKVATKIIVSNREASSDYNVVRMVKLAILSLVEPDNAEFKQFIQDSPASYYVEQLMIYRHSVINKFKLPALPEQPKSGILPESRLYCLPPCTKDELIDVSKLYFDPGRVYVAFDSERSKDGKTFMFVWENGKWSDDSLEITKA